MFSIWQVYNFCGQDTKLDVLTLLIAMSTYPNIFMHNVSVEHIGSN